MMEDPAFLESMKAYAEQLTKDPMFDQLKEQGEQCIEDMCEGLDGILEEFGGPLEKLVDLGGRVLKE